MNKNPDIPEEMYGRWRKVIGQEFGEVLPPTALDKVWVEQNDSSAEQEMPKEQHMVTLPQKPEQSNETRPVPNQQSKLTPFVRLTKEEEDDLAKFLNFGMTIAEAREMRANKKKLSEVKQQMREQRRATERGAIVNRGSRSAETSFG